MKLSHRALLYSLIGNAITVLPLMLMNGFDWVDSILALLIVALFGALPAIRLSWNTGIPNKMKRVLVGKFVLFTPVLVLVIYAIGRSVLRYDKTGLITPGSAGHWLSILTAAGALAAWFVYFHRLERLAAEKSSGA